MLIDGLTMDRTDGALVRYVIQIRSDETVWHKAGLAGCRYSLWLGGEFGMACEEAEDYTVHSTVR